MAIDIKFELLIGSEIAKYIDDIAKLRMEEFSNFPYLYKGNLAYERKYLKCYAANSNATLALAKIDDVPVGISTGIPLVGDSEIVEGMEEIFSAHHLDPHHCYYYGEIIIKPEYRGLGLASTLYKMQDKVIKPWGYKQACILTVVREKTHPLRPKNYQEKDGLWEYLGYRRLNIFQSYDWPTIQPDGSVLDEKNSLEFWIKDL